MLKSTEFQRTTAAQRVSSLKHKRLQFLSETAVDTHLSEKSSLFEGSSFVGVNVQNVKHLQLSNLLYICSLLLIVKDYHSHYRSCWVNFPPRNYSLPPRLFFNLNLPHKLKNIFICGRDSSKKKRQEQTIVGGK